MNIEWNEARIEILCREWKKGTTASRIAELLGGVSRNAVIGKASRLGLPGRKSPIKTAAMPMKRTPSEAVKKAEFWTPERIDTLKAGYSPDTVKSPFEISAALGCSIDRVYDKARELKLVHPNRSVRKTVGEGTGEPAAISRHLSDRVADLRPKLAPASLGITMGDLKPGSCRFPTTPHAALEHRFCGADIAAPGTPYCAYHHAICFRHPEAAEAPAPALAAE